MQIERDIQCLDSSPEGPILRHVVIHRVVQVSDLRESIDQRTDKSKVLHAAFRRLHGQRGKSPESIRAFCNLPGQKIIGAPRQLISRVDIGYGLTAGALSERIIISMPCSSIFRICRSWMSIKRNFNSS